MFERKTHIGTVLSIYNNAATTTAPMVAATVVAVAANDPLSSKIPSKAVGSVTAKSSVVASKGAHSYPETLTTPKSVREKKTSSHAAVGESQ